MERFRVGVDEDGNRCITSTNGTRIVFTSPDENESAVVAERTAAMLDQHARLQALELGHTTGYSGLCTLPHSVGSDHLEQRRALPDEAHQAELLAEEWDLYCGRLTAALTPPKLGLVAKVDDAGVNDGRGILPPGAREIPDAMHEAMRTMLGYAATNYQAYAATAKQCRDQLRRRYAGEDAAMETQAAAQMADELDED